MTRRGSFRTTYGVALALAMPISAFRAEAQARLGGTVVVAGDTRERIVSAQVTIAGTLLRTLTYSSGSFQLGDVPAGSRWVVIRSPAYEADSFLVAFADGERVTRDFVVRARLTQLAKVSVTAKAEPQVAAKMAGFAERQRMGIGRFLDRDAIAKWETHRTAEMLATLSGVQIRHSNSSRSWAVSGRAVAPGKCAFCNNRSDSVLDAADYQMGARLACYMDVYVDGAIVYSSTSLKAPLFDVNSIPPSQIEAVEVYLSASQIPAAYNRTSGGCGVMLIWTRIR